jgi:hypothetical protein
MGSKLGWILAVILVTVVVVVVVKFVVFPSPTLPTPATTAPGRLALLGPAEPVTLVLPAEPSAPGDAGEDYASAMQLRRDNLQALRDVFIHINDVQSGKYHLTDADLDLLKRTIAPLDSAAQKKEMTYYFRLTSQKIEIPYWPKEEMSQFQDLCDTPLMLAAHHIQAGKDSYGQAENCYFDVFAIGLHLINERARLDLVRLGIGLEKLGCERLEKLYTQWGRQDRAGEIKRYFDGLLNFSSTYGELCDLVLWRWQGQDSGMQGLHPGDIFNLAENHPDRSVRVEATLGLGVVKLTCSRRGDHKRVAELVRRKLASHDPIERVAGKCADELNAEGFKRLLTAKM